MAITLTIKELFSIFDLAKEMISAEMQLEFAPKFDHYRSLTAETWTSFCEPELLSCSLFDDITELRKLPHQHGRSCTPVDLQRLAGVLLALAHEMGANGKIGS